LIVVALLVIIIGILLTEGIIGALFGIPLILLGILLLVLGLVFGGLKAVFGAFLRR
jgi:hypothetical protein